MDHPQGVDTAALFFIKVYPEITPSKCHHNSRKCVNPSTFLAASSEAPATHALSSLPLHPFGASKYVGLARLAFCLQATLSPCSLHAELLGLIFEGHYHITTWLLHSALGFSFWTIPDDVWGLTPDSVLRDHAWQGLGDHVWYWGLNRRENLVTVL